MRLLRRSTDGALSLTDDLFDQDIPEYVILSHTWGAARQEVTFQDFQSKSTRQRKSKAGYAKIQFCSDQAARDGYDYFWIDTCCIDKTNNVELTEAINSMFRWYREAARCYVYLSDVQVTGTENNDWQDDFRKSKWFTRGWTLQELLAPETVEFFSSDNIRLGDKTSLGGESTGPLELPLTRSEDAHCLILVSPSVWTGLRSARQPARRMRRIRYSEYSTFVCHSFTENARGLLSDSESILRDHYKV